MSADKYSRIKADRHTAWQTHMQLNPSISTAAENELANIGEGADHVQIKRNNWYTENEIWPLWDAACDCRIYMTSPYYGYRFVYGVNFRFYYACSTQRQNLLYIPSQFEQWKGLSMWRGKAPTLCGECFLLWRRSKPCKLFSSHSLSTIDMMSINRWRAYSYNVWVLIREYHVIPPPPHTQSSS